MIRKLLQNSTLALFALGAISAGCGKTMPGEDSSSAIQVAELPSVAGCDSLKRQPSLALRYVAVAGVDDLFLVQSSGQDLCIDSLAGIKAMVIRLNLSPNERAASNPMPGSDPNANTGDEASSNPMPGSDPNANAGSNPMPGTDAKKP